MNAQIKSIVTIVFSVLLSICILVIGVILHDNVVKNIVQSEIDTELRSSPDVVSGALLSTELYKLTVGRVENLRNNNAGLAGTILFYVSPPVQAELREKTKRIVDASSCKNVQDWFSKESFLYIGGESAIQILTYAMEKNLNVTISMLETCEVLVTVRASSKLLFFHEF